MKKKYFDKSKIAFLQLFFGRICSFLAFFFFFLVNFRVCHFYISFCCLHPADFVISLLISSSPGDFHLSIFLNVFCIYYLNTLVYFFHPITDCYKIFKERFLLNIKILMFIFEYYLKRLSFF